MAEFGARQTLAEQFKFSRAAKKNFYTGPRNETCKGYLNRTIGRYDRTQQLPSLIWFNYDDRFLLLKDPDEEFKASPKRALETANELVKRLKQKHFELLRDLRTYKHDYAMTQHGEVLRALAAENIICIWIERKLGRKANMVMNEVE